MYRLDAHIPKKSSLKISAVYPPDQTRKLLHWQTDGRTDKVSYGVGPLLKKRIPVVCSDLYISRPFKLLIDVTI